MNLSELTGENNYRAVEPPLDYRYPKRLVLRHDQPNKEQWARWFEDQYLSECARLGYIPEPKQETLL